jgi:hypothetical protein
LRSAELKEIYNAKLLVNKEPVELNPFVEEFLARVSVGSVTSLKGVDNIKILEISLENDDINIVVNGAKVDLISFPAMIIISTLRGLVSTLKGGDNTKSLNIKVEAKK